MQQQPDSIASNMDPTIRHLLTPDANGANPAPPLYTPTLDPALPEVTYHVYMSAETVFTSGTWYYFKVKDASERQTLWALQALKRPRYQIPSTSLSRATAFTTPCVVTHATPVTPSPRQPRPHGSAADPPFGSRAADAGQTRSHQTRGVGAAPLRFTWGARTFVWKKAAGWKNLTEELYEVRRQGPVAGSKTGKMQDECCAERLMWGESKYAVKKVAVLHFRSGLDQMFQELCLASQLTRLAVVLHGHDS